MKIVQNYQEGGNAYDNTVNLQQKQEKHGDEDWQNRMMKLELRVAQIPEYRNVAFFHHLMLKKCNN